MRCNDCNKFVSLDTETDPEMNSEDFDENSGEFDLSYTIKNNCENCGTELRSADFDFNGSVPDEIMAEHKGPYTKTDPTTGEEATGDHYLEMAVDTRREEKMTKGRREYGMVAEVTITCACQHKEDDPLFFQSFDDYIAGGEMDEC